MFGLQHDGQYGENVLTVTVERPTDARLGGDTCTIVSGLNAGITLFPLLLFGLHSFANCAEDWKLYSQDFLFLTRPKEFCDTINGTLLLDVAHKHKLFVKGFWICDLKVCDR